MKETLKKWYYRHLTGDESAILAVIIIGAVALFGLMGQVLTPVFIALILAYLMQGIADQFEKFGLPKNLALTASSLVFTGCICNKLLPSTRCLKIIEKVSFNIASEASYVYILSGQKLIKNAKNGPFWRVFENLKLAVKQCYQTGQF